MIQARPSSISRSLGVRIALVVCGSLFMALSARLSVPVGPVPITGQTLAIPLLVALLGRNLATAALITYLAEGAAGLPVFAPGALMSATGGYLLAFPAAAFAIGLLFERGFGRNYPARFVAILAGTALVFAGGVAWLVAVFHLSPQQAVASGVLPFMFGDFLKCAIAAGVAPAWPKIATALRI
jgi:biotin transport system substrate-specific component